MSFIQQQEGWTRLEEVSQEGWFLRRAGEGEVEAGLPNDHVNILMDGSHTRGLSSFMEYRIAAHGEGPFLHWHRAHDEFFYVVSGQLSMHAAGTEHTLGPRDFLFAPRGVVHSFWNDTDEECVFVSGWTPPGAERMFSVGWTPEYLSTPEGQQTSMALIETTPASADHKA